MEANFRHSAFSLLKESGLEETELYKHFTPKQPSKGSRRSGKDSPAVSTFGDQHGRLAPGELIRKLWTAVKWEEVERHVGPDGVRLHSSQGMRANSRHHTKNHVQTHSTSYDHTTARPASRRQSPTLPNHSRLFA